MINQNNVMNDTKKPESDTKKYLFLIIGIVAAGLFTVSLIGALLVYGRIKEVRKLQSADEAAYSDAMRRCGKKPYMVINKDDPIEGVNVGSYYYEPTHPNYDKAKQKSFKDSIGFLGFDYMIEYECSLSSAQKLYIKRGK
ncbi:hypothetical protein KC952_04405 [Candidatus Saccharibacteria bacterium]|jgi:hypothetical protein|nr:hypothetical protein [Candidatus Saccharibacteria bacterium]MCA9341740.1 hypothetical protein [Candidatus Saccharibacteria bacterium]MDQ5969625.1 hypothetical protein [Patescibacteria group bacterium]